MENAKFSIRLQPDVTALDGLSLRETSHLEFELPGKFEISNLNKMVNDCDIMKEMLQKHPGDVVALFNHSLKGEKKLAGEIGYKIGFTEERFIEKGGGVAWLLIAAGILLYSRRAE